MNMNLLTLIVLFILLVAGSVKLLINSVKAKQSTIVSKSTLFNKCEKLAILIVKPYNSLLSNNF